MESRAFQQQFIFFLARYPERHPTPSFPSNQEKNFAFVIFNVKGNLSCEYTHLIELSQDGCRKYSCAALGKVSQAIAAR
jgi:hypothetical protein